MLVLDKFSQNMTQYGRGKWPWNKMKKLDFNKTIVYKEAKVVWNLTKLPRRTEMR